MKNFIPLVLFAITSCTQPEPFLAPVALTDRSEISAIKLSSIGDFGLPRVERLDVPAHLHTGIDISRPSNHYQHDPIYPITSGQVISKRTDGPYAQLILEHQLESDTFWTLYEHVAEILVDINQVVSSDTEIARFFNKKELNQYGWQFDHFHFEILKHPPVPIKPPTHLPQRRFMSYTLHCMDEETLLKYFHDPLSFLKKHAGG